MKVLKCAISTGIKAELLVNVDNPSEHKIWAELAKNTSGASGDNGLLDGETKMHDVHQM